MVFTFYIPEDTDSIQVMGLHTHGVEVPDLDLMIPESVVGFSPAVSSTAYNFPNYTRRHQLRDPNEQLQHFRALQELPTFGCANEDSYTDLGFT